MSTEADPLDAVRLLNVNQLSRLLGISPRSLWRMAALSEAGQGDGFPKPITIGPRLRRWRAVDVQSYVAHLAGRGRT